jgi:hypothetical protein
MEQQEPMVFELSVAGPLGPILRSALLPRMVVWSGRCTVLHTSGSSPDLAGLATELALLDLTIDSVRVLASAGHSIQGPCQPPSAAVRASAAEGPHEPGA